MGKIFFFAYLPLEKRREERSTLANTHIATLYSIATCTRARDLKSLLKSLRFGDEPRALTHALYGARERAVERLTLDCVRMGANAVVGVAFAETEVLGVAQVSVSGTAVYVERENPNGAGGGRQAPQGPPPAFDVVANK